MADAEVQTVLVSGPVSYSILSYVEEDGCNDLIVYNFGDKHVYDIQNVMVHQKNYKK